MEKTLKKINYIKHGSKSLMEISYKLTKLLNIFYGSRVGYQDNLSQQAQKNICFVCFRGFWRFKTVSKLQLHLSETFSMLVFRILFKYYKNFG